MARYVKRPVRVEAEKWDGTASDMARIQRIFPDAKMTLVASGGSLALEIGTLENTTLATPGYYIVRGVKGEYYPCRADIFEETHVADPLDAPHFYRHDSFPGTVAGENGPRTGSTPAEQPRIYFCGVWPGNTAGHHAYLPRGGTPDRGLPFSPWGSIAGNDVLDDSAVMAAMGVPDPYKKHEEPEGVRHHRIQDGWTLVSWWDRSGDSRHASIAAFAMEGEYEADVAERHARNSFPGVFLRMDKHLEMKR